MVIDFLRKLFSPSSLKSRVYFTFNGQINESSEIGRWIQTLSFLAENKSIVEIGTWNGRGSSKMIALGIEQKLSVRPELAGSCRVTGFEINEDMYKKSKKFLAKHSFFQVIYGSVVLPEELDTQNLTKDERAWLQQDTERMVTAPVVEHSIPAQIDLLILDGGEFSTYAEFKKLENRIEKWIILDDTHTRKCRKVLDEIKENPRYLVVFESSERNGTAVIRVAS